MLLIMSIAGMDGQQAQICVTKLSIALYMYLFSIIETNCVYAISFAIEMKDRQILF